MFIDMERPLPTADELISAMEGHVPHDHSQLLILRAAWLLANLHQWVRPDNVTTLAGVSGSEVLWDIGIAEIEDIVRAAITDRVNRQACTVHNRVGLAVDELARAWQFWRHRMNHPPAHAATLLDLDFEAADYLAAARAAYDRIRTGDDWLPTPGPDNHTTT
ncbi:hypothetical protein [Nocardia cyriacigeorgica]|uniref:hypothetical protein n=1 Tax=Nocardia cyriacigeorgica TaxID=135487 RepID=UPI0024545548|nr:hypothetical protein [Nocardia cyriacigeorgica]